MTPLEQYKQTPEYAQWMKAHTFGGATWTPDNLEKGRRMRIERVNNLIEEVEWLLQMGEHPLLIAQELHFDRRSFARTLERRGMREMAHLFAQTYKLDTFEPLKDKYAAGKRTREKRAA